MTKFCDAVEAHYDLARAESIGRARVYVAKDEVKALWAELEKLAT